jgi:hypothetical protein
VDLQQSKFKHLVLADHNPRPLLLLREMVIECLDYVRREVTSRKNDILSV